MAGTGYKNWRTPSGEGKIFTVLDEEFNFTIDAAASHANAKLSRYCTEQGKYIREVDLDGLTRGQMGPDTAVRIAPYDGLDVRAWEGERVFCNPPYDDIMPWLQTAIHGFATSTVPLSVLLLPPSVDTDWFRDIFPDKALARMEKDENWISFKWSIEHDPNITHELRIWNGRVKFMLPKSQVSMLAPTKEILQGDSVRMEEIQVPDESDPESVEGPSPRAGNIVVVFRVRKLPDESKS